MNLICLQVFDIKKNNKDIKFFNSDHILYLEGYDLESDNNLYYYKLYLTNGKEIIVESREKILKFVSMIEEGRSFINSKKRKTRRKK